MYTYKHHMYKIGETNTVIIEDIPSGNSVEFSYVDEMVDDLFKIHQINFKSTIVSYAYHVLDNIRYKNEKNQNVVVELLVHKKDIDNLIGFSYEYRAKYK